MFVYLCIEEEEYDYNSVECIYDNEEGALEWLESQDAGKHGKSASYGRTIINEIHHVVEGEDIPCSTNPDWKDLWYKYDGFGKWWIIEKRELNKQGESK